MALCVSIMEATQQFVWRKTLKKLACSVVFILTNDKTSNYIENVANVDLGTAQKVSS